MNTVILEDVKTLRSYAKGKVIEEGDSAKINKLTQIGLMKKGIRLSDGEETAKTSALGMRLIQCEQ
jgi:hypothetical protein